MPLKLASVVSLEARRKLLASLQPRKACGPDWSPEVPHPKQQAFLLLSGTREVLYGGAAAGGKSSSLLLGALQYVCVPGYAALLIRQTYPQLVGEDGLIDRARHWLAPHIKAGLVTWKASDKLFTFTQSGATIRFGHMQRDDDKYQFQGHAYQYVGIDELTHWPDPRAYLYVGFSRVRGPSADSVEGQRACPTCGTRLCDVPWRTRAGANPGSRGHAWVRQRFVIAPPTADRKFVPARIEDNPSVDQEGYIRGLAELDPVERVRLLKGDWDIREDGRVFRRHWFTGWNVPGTRTVAA